MLGVRSFVLRHMLLASVLLILPCLAGRALAQTTFVNLIANGNFDTKSGLSDWSPSNSSGVSFVSNDDQAGSSSSGSAAITSATNNFTSLSQCVQLPANWRSLNLTMSFWTNNPPITIFGPGLRPNGTSSGF